MPSSSNNEAASSSDELVGFVCGTLTKADRLTHESMQQHDMEDTTLCIHSVSHSTLLYDRH